jgi:preprotein translocase subunit SecY
MQNLASSAICVVGWCFCCWHLVVYRIGAHIPVPGIDPAQLQQLFQGQQGGILGMFNMFSGGALSGSPFSHWGSCRIFRHRSSCS